jgi:hypothetical protein
MWVMSYSYLRTQNMGDKISFPGIILSQGTSFSNVGPNGCYLQLYPGCNTAEVKLLVLNLRLIIHTFVCFWHNPTPPPNPPKWARASSFTRFLDHTQRRTTVGKTPLDKWSARRRDLYRTRHNTHNRGNSMPLVGFELKISAGERPQIYTLDRSATGTDTAP